MKMKMFISALLAAMTMTACAAAPANPNLPFSKHGCNKTAVERAGYTVRQFQILVGAFAGMWKLDVIQNGEILDSCYSPTEQ